jgi:hypothetical protein
MNTRSHTSKLAELRSRTDRQLYQLVARKLDRARTVRAWEEVRSFLPYLSRTDRRRIEERLEELEQPGPRTHAACF